MKMVEMISEMLAARRYIKNVIKIASDIAGSGYHVYPLSEFTDINKNATSRTRNPDVIRVVRDGRVLAIVVGGLKNQTVQEFAATTANIVARLDELGYNAHQCRSTITLNARGRVQSIDRIYWKNGV